MSEFNFKSQPATSREQSERLLKLGLKKETADMIHQPTGTTPFNVWYKEEIEDNFYPAWSLHRLMILAEMKGIAFLDLNTAYETTISIIAAKIRFKNFNKEYLVCQEEKK